MATYKITLEIEHLPEGPDLGASPDLPGLIVQAETAEEVIRLAPDIAADVIQVMQEDHLVEKARETGEVLSDMLQELMVRHPSVGDVRSIGLFGVIELVRNRKTKEPMAPFNSSSPEMTAFRKFMLDHGVFVSIHWHTVLIIPPLIITPDQLAQGFTVIDQALKITDAAAQ